MKTLLKKIMFLVIGQLICVFSLFAQENITIVDTNSSEKMASDSIIIVPFGSAVRKDSVKVSALTEVLRGRVSGLISYQTTGETKKDSTNLFINCGCPFSYRANPLILIDEVESSTDDLARLSPDDIDKFSIFKDATALEMFGTRGTNGVIRIFTKLGSKDFIESEINTSNVETENQFID